MQNLASVIDPQSRLSRPRFETGQHIKFMLCYVIYLFIMQIVPRYTKIMQKNTKKEKKQKNIQKKQTQNTSHGAYIVHNRLYI